MSKFHAKKCYIGGVKVADSKLENRHRNLFLQAGFDIQKVKIELIPKQKVGNITIRACSYLPDFTIKFGDFTYYIDSKGFVTADFKIKAKLMAQRGTPILCVKNNTQVLAVISLIKSRKSPAEIYCTLEH